MRKIILISIMALAPLLKTLQAQDIHFAQTWMTPLLLNPAQSGAETKFRAIFNHRNQWKSIAIPYVTSDISVDVKIGNSKETKSFSAIGLTVFHDKSGNAEISTLQGNISYAYHIYLNDKSTLGAGLYGGLAQYNIDYTELQWMNQYNGQMYDASLPSGEPIASNSFSQLDMGGGIHYQYGKGERYMTANDQARINGGIAFFHANGPKRSFYGMSEKQEMKIVGYANALIGMENSNLEAGPSVIYFSQGKMSELIMGSMFRYALKAESKYTGFESASAISLGLHYRNKDALIISTLYEISKYAIGISYDVNVSGLKSASNSRGAFEISLRFINPNPFGSSSKSRI
jgi:type IX secretion system PorP/SprF family membrane protein